MPAPAPAGSPAGLLHLAVPGSHRRGAQFDATEESQNWFGYDAGAMESSPATRFTSVSAAWTVPTATAHRAGEAESSSTWIGIGGGCVNSTCTVTSDMLIQAGTNQDVDPAGDASYSAWWEMVPDLATMLPLSVAPGDGMQVAIMVGSGGDVVGTPSATVAGGDSFSDCTWSQYCAAP